MSVTFWTVFDATGTSVLLLFSVSKFIFKWTIYLYIKFVNWLIRLLILSISLGDWSVFFYECSNEFILFVFNDLFLIDKAFSLIYNILFAQLFNFKIVTLCALHCVLKSYFPSFNLIFLYSHIILIVSSIPP